MKNKTSSAVQLKHIPSGMVIKSQATRSRSQNRKIARRILAEKLEAIEKGPESRVALKAESKKRKKASKSKKAKRKYRALDGVEGDEEISDASEDRKTRAKEELEEGTA
ncbi:hypothetical protein MMC06_003652 [Schaereria dolodes]|nr:hypothetical protein [Schaereria dolodes]